MGEGNNSKLFIISAIEVFIIIVLIMIIRIIPNFIPELTPLYSFSIGVLGISGYLLIKIGFTINYIKKVEISQRNYEMKINNTLKEIKTTISNMEVIGAKTEYGDIYQSGPVSPKVGYRIESDGDK